MLVTFHNESWGGEKFFQLLSRISQSPQQHLWLLEIIHYCLLLGYEGRYRGSEKGRAQCDSLRARLKVLIDETRAQQAPIPLRWCRCIHWSARLHVRWCRSGPVQCSSP